MFQIEQFGNRRVLLRGLGKMFYQEGTPIGLLAHKVNAEGIEVSWLHVADELQKHGWLNKTILSKLREETSDSQVAVDMEAIGRFLEATYEDQREMIFQYLFGSPSADVIASAKARNPVTIAEAFAAEKMAAAA